jgi:hypothetical protein
VRWSKKERGGRLCFCLESLSVSTSHPSRTLFPSPLPLPCACSGTAGRAWYTRATAPRTAPRRECAQCPGGAMRGFTLLSSLLSPLVVLSGAACATRPLSHVCPARPCLSDPSPWARVCAPTRRACPHPPHAASSGSPTRPSTSPLETPGRASPAPSPGLRTCLSGWPMASR